LTLDYPQKANGLFVLSRAQIDEIAMMVLTKYAPHAAQHPGTLDIERLVQEDFCLTILDKYMRQDYLGLTAFDDLTIQCHDLERQVETLEIGEGTIVLNATLLHEQNARRRRFTLAHELAHWVLHRSFHSPDNQEYSFRHIACRAVNRTYYRAWSNYEWEEWQADKLAAALLMPEPVVRMVVGKGFAVTYDSWYYNTLSTLADLFYVSRRAIELRLTQLGLLRYVDIGMDSDMNIDIA